MSEIAVIKGHDIRDKKLADATSQSTVASTDAIEMKTTTGDQVYITRDSFVQAMASVLNSNSQSTISQLFGADANGNHAAINMSNLASVLGVLKTMCVQSFDWNIENLPIGIYNARTSQFVNGPVSNTNACQVFVLPYADTKSIIYFDLEGGHIYGKYSLYANWVTII